MYPDINCSETIHCTETNQQPISLLRSAQVMPSLLLNSLESCKTLLPLDGLIPMCSLLSAAHFLLHVHTVFLCLARPPLVPAVVAHNCSQMSKVCHTIFRGCCYQRVSPLVTLHVAIHSAVWSCLYCCALSTHDTSPVHLLCYRNVCSTGVTCKTTYTQVTTA